MITAGSHDAIGYLRPLEYGVRIEFVEKSKMREKMQRGPGHNADPLKPSDKNAINDLCGEVLGGRKCRKGVLIGCVPDYPWESTLHIYFRVFPLLEGPCDRCSGALPQEIKDGINFCSIPV